ncbi:MAG: hypothetical protein F4Y92_06800 [Dehalococcoidia bacterium]|nr:hypothetical protein [Dehalococcoidia bacterium]
MPTLTLSTPAEREAHERLSDLVPWMAKPRDALRVQAAEIAIQLWLQDPAMTESVVRSKWFQDGTTAHEVDVLRRFADLASRSSAVAAMIAETPWFNDVVTERERDLFDLLARGDLSPSFLDEHPEDAGRFSDHLVRFFISALSGMTPGALATFERQPWFADGLAPLEAAFAIAVSRLPHDNPMLLRDLLQRRYIATRSTSLPLAGEVSLYLVQNSPIPDSEAILDRIEATARLMEEWLAAPFPTTDIILLLGDATAVDYGIYRGGHFGSHMRLTRYEYGVPSIPHETAHYYFQGVGETRWFVEGAAELTERYLDDAVDISVYVVDGPGDGPAPEEAPPPHAVSCLIDDGAQNIRHFDSMAHERHGVLIGDYCTYSLGEWFLTHLFDAIGPEALGAGLGHWYQQQESLAETFGQSRTWRVGLVDTDPDIPNPERVIYDSLSQAVPEHARDAFEKVYRELHGGVSGGPLDDIPDDVGDTIQTASPLSPGELVEGALEHAFDFDYFVFKATSGQKYELRFEHATPTSSLALYSMPLTNPYLGRQFYERWGTVLKRVTSASGDLTRGAVWVAPRSFRYYVAVQNFGGPPGPYRMSIVALKETPDDHGDSQATATEVTLLQPVEGTLEGEQDIDYFRFQPVEGQRFHVEVAPLEGEPPRVCVYNREGRATTGRSEDCSVRRDGGVVSFEWTAWSPYDFYLAVSGGTGVVSYTLLITPVEE